jgi:hypothetical protein
LDLSKYQAPLGQELIDEIERSNPPVEKLLSEALKYVDGTEEQDLAVERYFIDKGYSATLSGWLVREANTRKAAKP